MVQVFFSASDSYGLPASSLSDNAAVFSGRSRGGKVALELGLERLGIEVKHSTPCHPPLSGKVERLHQTLKRYLRQQAPQSLAPLQLQPSATTTTSTGLTGPGQANPAGRLQRSPQRQADAARIANPLPGSPPPHRLQRKVTLRSLSKLRYIPVGAAHRNRKVLLLVAGANVRIVTTDGTLLRELTVDPTATTSRSAGAGLYTMSCNRCPPCPET